MQKMLGPTSLSFVAAFTLITSVMGVTIKDESATAAQKPKPVVRSVIAVSAMGGISKDDNKPKRSVIRTAMSSSAKANKGIDVSNKGPKKPVVRKVQSDRMQAKKTGRDISLADGLVLESAEKMKAGTSQCLSASHVPAPWTHMDEYQSGGESRCNECAQGLQDAGVLEAGWQCNHGSWLWWYWYIQRPATHTNFSPASSLVDKSFNLADITGAGPIVVGGSGLPTQLRGAFWLTEQGDSSALMSFGSGEGSADGPNTDGAYSSKGRLINKRLRVRVAGDRVWSFAGQSTGARSLVAKADLVYEFEFNDQTNPTHAQIHGTSIKGGFTAGERTEWVLDFEMELLPEGRDVYPGSVVWLRRSSLFGMEITAKQYDLVQVVDESGQHIQPAWDKFVAYQATQSQPGTLHYRARP